MKSLIAFGYLLLFSVALSQPASALLIEIDRFSPGDALITRDTTTGLDWLDLTESVNLSFNEVLAGAGGFLDDGWRHATGAELCGVLSQVASSLSPGDPCLGGGFGASSPTGQTEYTDLFGATRSDGATFGHFDDDRPPAGLTGRLILTQNANTGGWVLGVFPASSDVNGSVGPEVGHFLVRAVIPEPTTALLTGVGLACLGALRSPEA